tara:strand:+ start:786 stop:1868 length:1083 start_codon:yes stop_codon:yes gene_type:complete
MAYTTIDDPSAHFQIATYTGNANFNTITNDGNSVLAPDFVWGKCRTTTKTHYVYDTIRGTEKRIEPDNSGVEDTGTNGLYIFQSDGFKLASGNTENDDGESYVAWQWKGNGGTTSSNTDGNITTTLQVNSTAGFSMGTYTGINGYKTIGHGLGAIPDLVMIKGRGSNGGAAQYWVVGAPNHTNFGNSASKHVFLDTTNAVMNNTTIWYNTAFTTTTIPIGTHAAINTTDGTYVFYAFKNIKGYSRIGHYTGNGTSNGPFVYTGFKPAFILIKNLDATQVWIMYDIERKSFNQDAAVNSIYASETSAEYTGASYHNLDILSNGFKIRLTDASQNGSGVDYLYMAFAHNPFVTSTGVPTTAQ